jgi:hypothetical protein
MHLANRRLQPVGHFCTLVKVALGMCPADQRRAQDSNL